MQSTARLCLRPCLDSRADRHTLSHPPGRPHSQPHSWPTTPFGIQVVGRDILVSQVIDGVDGMGGYGVHEVGREAGSI